MKIHAALTIVLVTVAWDAISHAQSCTMSITGWKANYVLGTSATSACTGPFDTSGTCTYNQSTAANPNLSGGGCSWKSLTDSVSSLSFDDSGTWPCPSPPGGTLTESYDGTSGKSSSFLTIDASNGTYTFNPEPVANVTETISGCTSGSGPGTPAAYPASNWPQTFNLPEFVQPLTQTNFSFQALDAMFGDNPDVPWTFTFTLTPKYHCKPCEQNGGPGTPLNSTLGSENQSLGEDVPIVGTGFNLHYESERAVGANGDSFASADAAMIGGWTLSIHHAYDPDSNTLFLGDGGQRNGYQLGTPLLFDENLLLTSEDGSEVYVFSLTTGQHLQTLGPLTGALVYQFGYDSAGELVTVTDATGNVTTIERNASEQPTAIVSPYGQTTNLSVDSNGYLSQVTDPLGNSSSFQNSSTGLLQSRTDANGNVFNYTYDANGGLTKDADPLGGYVSTSRSDANSGFGWTVAETTSMGVTSSYQTALTLPWFLSSTSSVTEQHTNIWPEGLQATSSTALQSGQLSNNVVLPDGTTDSQTLGPDPVWGIQVPVNASESFVQGNLTMTVSGSRATTLGTAGNPFTVASETDTQSVNGRTYTSAFTGSNLTFVNSSPAGRTVTIGLDTLERLASAQVGGLTATDFSYDSHGRLESEVQGSRKASYSYSGNGFLASVTDPLKLKTSYTYDADGQLQTTMLPDSQTIEYTYDANGNLTSVTPPGKSAHGFSYNAVDEVESYTPPTVAGTGATTYAYNLDRNLTMVTRPDGETIDYAYDTAGRVISVTIPGGSVNYAYDATTGNVTSEERSGEKIKYSYNGPLVSTSSWSGTVAGRVSRNYDDNFWASSQSVAGGSKIAFGYDNDGLVTKAGSLEIKRSSKNGLITGTTLGVATDSRTYNSFGELIGYTASISGTAIYSVQYTRDADGRVTAKTETINGTTNTYSYTYDQAGRLTSATTNSVTDTYTYDTNSNRLSGTTSSGTSNGTYDAQDRLLTYGNASYTYTANGELASQKVGTQKTTYKYDVLGNLTAVTLANGTKLSYIIDAENERAGKEANGVLESGFLYDEDNRVVAQLNGSNQVMSQFVYGTGASTPDYMVNGGVTYRLFGDELGSPLLVVNSATGAIAELITYDEFGNVLSDSNPGFQPFGFAGGLYDQDTKLIRFGARDYNPAVGRWTAKDPLLFDGGDTNLYGYALNDPINRTDPSGLTIFRVDAVQFVTDARRHPCKGKKFKNPKPPKPEKPKPAPQPDNWRKEILPPPLPYPLNMLGWFRGL